MFPSIHEYISGVPSPVIDNSPLTPLNYRKRRRRKGGGGGGEGGEQWYWGLVSILHTYARIKSCKVVGKPESFLRIVVGDYMSFRSLQQEGWVIGITDCYCAIEYKHWIGLSLKKIDIKFWATMCVRDRVLTSLVVMVTHINYISVW